MKYVKFTITAAKPNKMTYGEFIKEVKALYKKYMPNSRINFRAVNLGGFSFAINPFVSKSVDELPNKIIHNDPLQVSFVIEHLGKNSYSEDLPMQDEIILEVSKKGIVVKPENKIYAASYFKLPFRKVKGDANKILKALDKNFKVIRDTLKELVKEDKLLPEDLKLVKTKI